jgi:hypothetical protein
MHAPQRNCRPEFRLSLNVSIEQVAGDPLSAVAPQPREASRSVLHFHQAGGRVQPQRLHHLSDKGVETCQIKEPVNRIRIVFIESTIQQGMFAYHTHALRHVALTLSMTPPAMRSTPAISGPVYPVVRKVVETGKVTDSSRFSLAFLYACANRVSVPL